MDTNLPSETPGSGKCNMRHEGSPEPTEMRSITIEIVEPAQSGAVDKDEATAEPAILSNSTHGKNAIPSPQAYPHRSPEPPALDKALTPSERVAIQFPSSPSNPLNWPTRRRMMITLCLALTGLMSTGGSSIGVPGLHAAMEEFGITNEKIGTLIPGAYVLGLGTGPFIFAPISELYGRQPAYYISQVLLCIFTLGTGFSNHMATLIILRFFCGMFGSVAPSLGVATCADLFIPQERGKPMSLYGFGPIAGPVIGNMVGYWLLFFGWRWAYYFMTIVVTLNTILMITVMRETYAPVIQKIMVYHLKSPEFKRSRQRSFPSTILPDLTWMKHIISKDEARAVYAKAFSRPPRLLLTNPVAFAFAMYYAYVYAVIYVFIVNLPLLFGQPPFSHPPLFSFSWPQATLPLAYIPIGMGFFTAVGLAARYQDKIYKYFSKRNGDKGQPEYRLILTQTGMCVMPIGLFIFGWTAHSQHHWMGPFVGQYVIGLGLVLAFNTLQNFFVDAFYPYSAAAIAGATATRSIVACILPLFTSEMWVKLGWGWGGTLLAMVAILGVPCPLIMFICGKRLRERYAFHG
ncbi:hypothetical protein I316_08034 [Kwoniella heveanensis BCC8398]|uniref:Major facilitator superfamily (MFS) profile domain-containing protein n=1 Tax=Kwoniella heveanensis BCC8398 TaxID=1296120 RepID=A0A1B9GH19_9TREE|nr:hypothetical protein I316_08034 [Kwoniella heveanensis BCC8398]